MFIHVHFVLHDSHCGVMAKFVNQSWKSTVPETNTLPLKMDAWNMICLLGRAIFKGYVSFRESN